MRYTVVMVRKDGSRLEIVRPGESGQGQCEWLAKMLNATRNQTDDYEYVVEDVDIEKGKNRSRD